MSVKVQLIQFLNLRQPTAGAMLFALQQLHQWLSPQRGDPPEVINPELKALVEEAMQLNTVSRSLDFDWRNQRKTAPLQREGITEIDARADRALSQLWRAISNWAELETEHPNRQIARKLRAELFPNGVSVTTALRYEDQNAAIDELLGRLDGVYSDDIDALGLQVYVTQLEEVNTEYAEKLSGLKERTLDYEQVKNAHQAGLQAYFVVVLRIWNDYFDKPGIHAMLMAPVEEQDQRISAYYKRRRVAPRVDPESGEIVEEDAVKPEADPALIAPTNSDSMLEIN